MVGRSTQAITCEAVRELLVAPRRNLYLANGERYVWLVADPDNDLEIEAAHEGDPQGGAAYVAPDIQRFDGPARQAAEQEAFEMWRGDWLEHERSGCGWAELLGFGSYGGEHTATWLLSEGIAPGQPFLVHFDPPIYTKSWTDCGYEYDADFPNAVLGVAPLKLEEIITAWCGWIYPEPLPGSDVLP